MESPRSLLARIKEERAQEQQWKRETARRRRKFKKMEEEQQQNSDYGQLTSEALSSHNKEKIRRKLRSFAHPSSCPTTADSDLTYATSLSRIETASVASAVPLSLLGAVPPSTAAGQVAPALGGRLAQKVRNNISKEEDRNNETAEEQRESSNTACSSPQQIVKAKLRTDFTIAPAEKTQETTEVVDHPPNQSVTKSTKEFLALEKEAVEHCEENSHDQVKAQPSSSDIAAVVDAPTVFSALPPIQKRFTKESEPVLAQKEHPVPSSESNNNTSTQTKKKRGVLPLPKVTSQPQQRAASTSSRPPRQQTAPFRRHEEDTSCPPPKGIIKPPIRRSESAPRAAVRQNPSSCLDSVEVVQKSGLEVFRPDAMERQGGRGGAVVAAQSGAANPQKRKKRAVFFNELANGGDVFVGHDGVQFNVARSIGVNSSMNSNLGISDAPPARSSGSAISFVQAMRQVRQNNNKPPTSFSIPDFELREDPIMREEPEEAVSEGEQEEDHVISSAAPPPKPILFGQPNPELFMDDDEEERDQWRSKEGEAEKDNDDEVTRSTPPPPQVLLASERPENVIPTGYSIEEKKLLEALNELNRKQYDQEIKAKGEKKKKTTAFQECSNTGVLSYGMPEPRYQPKKKTNASQGPRETPRLAENLPIRSYVPNSVFNKEVNGCGKRSVAASGASALSRRQAGGRRYLGVQPL